MRPVTEERPPGPAAVGTDRSPMIKGAKNESFEAGTTGLVEDGLGSFLLLLLLLLLFVVVALAKKRKEGNRLYKQSIMSMKREQQYSERG